MDKTRIAILACVSSLLILFASVSSAFACIVWAYQPETPKSLIK